MTDLAPTFLSLIGASLRDDFDGTPIPLVHSAEPSVVDSQRTMFREHINIEQWGTATPEGKYDKIFQMNTTYKAFRVIGAEYHLLYTVWCTGDDELYDLMTDHYETDNLYPLYSSNYVGSLSPTNTTSSMQILSTWIKRLVPRLDALVLVGKTCKADSCRNPWRVLHTQGTVHNLNEAMEKQNDEFYEESQNKVQFERCLQGYLVENELPIAVVPYSMDRL